jgi:hypothetical protein
VSVDVLDGTTGVGTVLSVAPLESSFVFGIGRRGSKDPEDVLTAPLPVSAAAPATPANDKATRTVATPSARNTNVRFM